MRDFGEWKRKVDELFVAKYGLTSDDFEDYLWYQDFKAYKTPLQAFVGWKHQVYEPWVEWTKEVFG